MAGKARYSLLEYLEAVMDHIMNDKYRRAEDKALVELANAVSRLATLSLSRPLDATQKERLFRALLGVERIDKNFDAYLAAYDLPTGAMKVAAE